MTINEQAKQVADATVDAYSRDRYTEAAWIGIAKLLLKAGASHAEAAWILNSKHTRWAADAADASGRRRTCNVTAADFAAYARGQKKVVGDGLAGLIEKARRELTPATLAGQPGADLAGFCEGEQIADLIDLARAVAQMEPSVHQTLIARAKALIAEIEGRAK